MRSRNANPLSVLILFGLISGVLFGFAAHGLYLDEQFASSALTSQASIKQGWITYGHKGSIHYHVTYLFRDRYFRQWTTTTSVARDTYTHLHANDVVPVRYLDDETGRSRIDWPSEAHYHWYVDESVLGFSLFIAAFAILIFVAKRR
jgi:hypothetical protein